MMKIFSIMFVLLLISCNSSKIKVAPFRAGANPSDSTTECPSGLQASVVLEETNPNNLVTQRSIRFRAEAAGCSNGYLLYVNGPSDPPIQFTGSTTYSRVYATAQTNITDSVTIVVLDSQRRPANQYTLTSAPFSISDQTNSASCRLDPMVIQVPISVDSNGRPLISSPPVINFTIKSNSPTRVTEVRPPDATWFQLSSTTPLPSATLINQHTVTGMVLVPISGAYEFGVVDGAGVTNRCAADVRVVPTLAPGMPTPQIYFMGDVTGDSIGDIVTLATDGTLWVAQGTALGGFNYKNFGNIPAPGGLVDILFADFNHDGKFDIIGRVQSTGMWKVAFSNGTQFVISDLGTWPADRMLTDIALSDPNNDGKPDLIGKLNGINFVSYLHIDAANPLSATMDAPIPLPATLNLTAFPLNPAFDGNIDASWTSDNTTACYLKVNGTRATLPVGANTAGNIDFTQLQANFTLQLECEQAGTPTLVQSNLLSILVQPPPPAGQDLKVKVLPNMAAANATVVEPGAKVWLAWTTQNLTACQLHQGGNVRNADPASSFVQSIAIDANMAFKLQCATLAGVNTETAPYTVHVKTDLDFSPPLIDVGSITNGSDSSAKPIVFSNPANRAKAANIRVTLPANWAWVSGCMTSAGAAFELATGASCTMQVKYKAVNGASTGLLRAVYNNGIADVTEEPVTLKGTGVAPPSGGS